MHRQISPRARSEHFYWSDITHAYMNVYVSARLVIRSPNRMYSVILNSTFMIVPWKMSVGENGAQSSIEDCRDYFLDGVQERDTPPISAVYRNNYIYPYCNLRYFIEIYLQ